VEWMYANPDTPVEHLAVPAGAVKVPELSPLQAEFVTMCTLDGFTAQRRWREESLYVMPVLRRSDGTLWAYDDVTFVTLFHRYAPAATVHVAIIGTDPE